ncbi:nucleoside triphosphate pyrophosphohydrolase [bacterium]|nr:nucleoside triphosphate pyrophosphohydrolase [bacterium]
MNNSFDDFVATIARLRGPDGCPWDREQTHQSLGRYLMEESYEVLEAIHMDDSKMLKEELGDLLLQIVLNAQIAKDNGEFDIFDVADSINQKMVSRHPHVFGENKLDHPDQVVAQWEELKEQEKREKEKGNGKSERRGALDSIPRALPALLQALKVSEKAVGQGFEWKEEEDVWDKLVSEMNEFREAVAEARTDDSDNEEKRRALNEEVELELGDMLFCLVNVARWQKVNPEEALLKSIEKFKRRFSTMETISADPLTELTKDQLYQLWIIAKEKSC